MWEDVLWEEETKETLSNESQQLQDALCTKLAALNPTGSIPHSLPGGVPHSLPGDVQSYLNDPPIKQKGKKYYTLLGWEPIKEEKTDFTLMQLSQVPLCDVVTRLVYQACKEEVEPSLDTIPRHIRDMQNAYLKPANDDRLWDVLTTDLKYNDKGQLMPFGVMPNKEENGFHPFLAAHAMMYLMKRGLHFTRPAGSNGKLTIRYDWNYFKSLRDNHGLDAVHNCLNKYALKVRLGILMPLVHQIFEIEGNNEQRIIFNRLPELGTFFCNNQLVILDNGIGAVKDETCAHKLTTHVSDLFGATNFGWEKRGICPYELAKQTGLPSPEHPQKADNVKPSPAFAMAPLFKAAYAVHCWKYGPSADLKLKMCEFVQLAVCTAKEHQHAIPIHIRQLRVLSPHSALAVKRKARCISSTKKQKQEQKQMQQKQTQQQQPSKKQKSKKAKKQIPVKRKYTRKSTRKSTRQQTKNESETEIDQITEKEKTPTMLNQTQDLTAMLEFGGGLLDNVTPFVF